MKIKYISRITKDGREQLTQQHLKECSEYAHEVGKKFSASKLCRFAALLHDIGKFSEEFVDYLKGSSQKRGSVIHSTQGAKFLYDLRMQNDFCNNLVCEIAAMCIANHHGGLVDCISPDGATPFDDKIKKENGDLNYEQILKNTEVNLIDKENVIENCKCEIQNFIDYCKVKNLSCAFMVHFLTKSVFSCLVDADRYNAYCFEINKKMEKSAVIQWDEYIERFEKKISVFSQNSDIDKIRSKISQKCFEAADKPKGIYRLEVPTGGGKTLSSLRFALHHAKKHNMEHIVYVIPYLSVLEQAAQNIKEALGYNEETDHFILEHHSNFVLNDNPDEAQSYNLLTERWDSPIIITTMVEFLESIYSNKASDLRKFHNMANAVFIFDEVQILPLKCVYLFNEAINYLHYCAGCSILLCTATQPPFEKSLRPIYMQTENALIDDASNCFSKLKRTQIVKSTMLEKYSIEKLRDFVLNKFKENGNSLVILNTKKNVADLYCSIESYLKENPSKQIKLFHLSTAMCPEHRLDKINEIKKENQENVICISTQLIEAGVDISFACVIRAVAGLDSIAQAAGRCNRNGEYSKTKDVYIVNLADEDLSMLPDIKCGADITYRIISEDNSQDLLSPDVIKKYYEQYFSRKEEKMCYPINDKGENLYDLLSKNEKGCGAYKNRFGGNPELALRQAFQTAGENFSVIDQKTVNVLVPYKNGKKLIEDYKNADIANKKVLMRKMQRYFVALYQNQFEELKEQRALNLIDNQIWILDKNYYDDNRGVVLSANNEFLGF